MGNQKHRIDRIEQRSGIHKTSSAPEWITLDESDKMTDDENHDACMRFIRNEPMPGILEYCDPVCARKDLDSASIDFLLESEPVPFPESRFVQIQRPDTKKWCLIDREKGRITESQETPFDAIPKISVK